MKNIFVSLAVMLFSIASSFAQEKLEVDGNAIISGKVGIGTPSAINKLDVRSSDPSSDIMQAQATWTAGSNSNRAALVGKNTVDAGFGFGVAGEGGQAGVLGNSANIGVQGEGGAAGVKGGSNANGGDGVTGESTVAGGAENVGVSGEASGSTNNNLGGVFKATTEGPGQNYGVLAEASGGAGGNTAGLFLGDVTITGALSKGSGSFKIDHPLDPENKYLYHSFVESPEMMNVYNGNITTDASGVAAVELPIYFMALNQDFRYQLTVIGTFAQAIISEEVSDNHFVIKTNEPSVKVSWQVTGIRKDPFAVKNRIQEEVDKAPNERGLYLHPEAYGQPTSMGISAKMMDALKLKRADKKAEDID